ncbi:type II secretion system protein GspM [Alteromonas oceanisediminis]|uniref:type II secretion system protein GspM n=1 Tax=Alteromonas oceanisediminis TaxID=2836180 RepID=UPI001BDB1AE6|nr:type II secretion system protein GspM [Alteromonas oceanisediminis]MBT0586866.1 type II secretion system protein M [Alteromonas oceanisediminis]
MLRELDTKFTALSSREKNLVVISAVVLILFVGFTFVVEPQSIENDRVELELANAKIELNGVEQQVLLLQEALQDDPNQALQARINALNERIDALDQAFSSSMRELVPAEQMPVVIDQMLQQASEISLLEMNSIPPTSVFAADSANADLPLYQHGVQFVFSGHYADILNYLKAVEGFPWQIYWRSLDYQVDEHPNATITLELFTLSTSKAFLGVK